MTDQQAGTDCGLTRRRVVRTAAAGATGLLAVARGAEEAAATNCPRPAGYWAEQRWPATNRVTDSFALLDGGDERSVAVWRILLGSPGADPGEAVARQLLAARLNFQYRPPDDPGCVDEPLAAYGDRTIRELKIAAKEWLEASNWPGDQPSWVVDGVDGEPLATALAAFNQGGLDELDCGCDFVDRDRRRREPDFGTVDGIEGGRTEALRTGDGDRRERTGDGHRRGFFSP